jgi:hypothetical protein
MSMPALELVIVANRSQFTALVRLGTRRSYQDMNETGTVTSQRKSETHTHEGLLISVQCFI